MRKQAYYSLDSTIDPYLTNYGDANTSLNLDLFIDESIGILQHVPAGHFRFNLKQCIDVNVSNVEFNRNYTSMAYIQEQKWKSKNVKNRSELDLTKNNRGI